MTAPHQVAFVGFSGFERATLESYFRLGDGSTSAYQVCADLSRSDLVVADADRPDVVFAVGRAGRVRDTIFVGGKHAPRNGGMRLPRPIDALQLRRTLDAMALRRNNSRRTDRPGSRRPDRPSGRVQQWALDAMEVQDFHRSSGFSNSVLVEGESRLDEVLVVSGSPAERRLLCDLLDRYGYPVSLARDVKEALHLTRQRDYGFVFLGLAHNSQESFQACRLIKRRPTLLGVAPVVVALAHRLTAIDRIRATFAGCDAYLGMPIDESELLKVLARHDRTFERVFEPTARITPSLRH